MKYFKTTTFIIFLILMPLLLSAQQEQEVLLASYPYDTETVSEQIEEVLTHGYIPVGLEVSPGREIAVLYAPAGELEAERYVLYQFDDASSFEAEFTEFIKEGWLPMDISYIGDSFYGIFIRSPYEIEGWRLTSTSLNEEEMSETLTDFREQGFHPWGISGLEDRLWFLLLAFEDHEPGSFFVNFYTIDDEELKEKIESDLASGWRPWGLMKRGYGLSILYTQ